MAKIGPLRSARAARSGVIPMSNWPAQRRSHLTAFQQACPTKRHPAAWGQSRILELRQWLGRASVCALTVRIKPPPLGWDGGYPVTGF